MINHRIRTETGPLVARLSTTRLTNYKILTRPLPSRYIA
jgi:hypothetical protein